MSAIPEKYADRPQLWRAACELSKSKDLHKTLNILRVMLSNRKEAGAA